MKINHNGAPKNYIADNETLFITVHQKIMSNMSFILTCWEEFCLTPEKKKKKKKIKFENLLNN